MSAAPLAPSFVALALAIVAASALALSWLLHAETPTTRLQLAVLTALALTLRLAWTTDFPAGLNEDEPKVLAAAVQAVQRRTLLAESNISVPILMHALFQGQLLPLLGSDRWAIRLYSLVGGVLCVPAAFAAARAMQLSVAPSLAVAGLIAGLPWALFYSRVMQGAELTFQQLLLLAALARLVFRPATRDAPRAAADPGWREWALGSFALAWLLYGYWCTRAMVGMPFVAAGLASGRRRLWCLAIPAVGLLLYAPYVAANRNSMFISQGVSPTHYAELGGLREIAERTRDAAASFVWPVAQDGWLTVRAGALHPTLLLVLALFGALSGVRRAIFLLAGFLGGLAPAILAWGAPSTHRMLMAFPFVALGAGCALEDLIPWPRARRAACAALVLAVGWYGARLYFSTAFWPGESSGKFDWARTALMESLPLPPSPPVVLMRQVSTFREPRRLFAPDDRDLAVDNWFPDARGAIYGFTSEAAILRPFYENLIGVRHVDAFGQAFTVTFEPGDWAWLRRHGWTYTARCGTEVRRTQIPVLFQPNFTFADLTCDRPMQHTWQARWDGPATPLRLRAEGDVAVDAGARHIESSAGADVPIDFAVDPGTELRITIDTPAFNPWAYATLLERAPTGERVPDWERAVPLP